MDITKYLSNIELPATDEKQAKDFLTAKGKELKENISKLWEEFLLSENENAGVEKHGTASLLETRNIASLLQNEPLLIDEV